MKKKAFASKSIALVAFVVAMELASLRMLAVTPSLTVLTGLMKMNYSVVHIMIYF